MRTQVDRDGLPAALESLRVDGEAGGTLVERAPLPFGGTTPKELVVCELADGRRLKLFCKHSYAGPRNGNRRSADVAFEAEVYRSVLEPIELPTARFYGSHEAGPRSPSFLFLEYLQGAGMVHKAEDSSAVVRAAEWLGRFHARTEQLVAIGEAPLTRRLDVDYYVGSARRTVAYVGIQPDHRWVADACAVFEHVLAEPLTRRPVVAHGEYYGKNILILKGRIYPVDWECAAVGAGETDLATLTAGWPEALVRRCEDAYVEARWPDGAPGDFDGVLTAARLHNVLRWLGDRPDRTNSPAGAPYLRELRRIAVNSGILPGPDGRRRPAPRRVRDAVGPAAGAAEPYRPDLSELEHAVRTGLRRDDVEVVTREHPRSRGSYPSEVVTCRLGGSRELRVYCKYGHSPRGQGAHGHRRGVEYEAQVYRELLEPLPLPTAGFHGSYTDRRGATWLLLDHIEDAVRLHRTPHSGAMVDAARWLGRFHAASESRAHAAIDFLKRYDADYYRGWVRRTRRFGADWQPRLTWLEGLCARFEELVEELLEAPQTTVHGEYYPNNILWREGQVYPLDWETAAIGPGELDLAMLTEGWSVEVAGRCELAYRDARWPDGAPPAFERALTIARSYAQFRWLGDNWNWTIYSRESPSRFERLRLEGELLGAI